MTDSETPVRTRDLFSCLEDIHKVQFLQNLNMQHSLLPTEAESSGSETSEQPSKTPRLSHLYCPMFPSSEQGLQTLQYIPIDAHDGHTQFCMLLPSSASATFGSQSANSSTGETGSSSEPHASDEGEVDIENDHRESVTTLHSVSGVLQQVDMTASSPLGPADSCHDKSDMLQLLSTCCPLCVSMTMAASTVTTSPASIKSQASSSTVTTNCADTVMSVLQPLDTNHTTLVPTSSHFVYAAHTKGGQLLYLPSISALAASPDVVQKMRTPLSASSVTAVNNISGAQSKPESHTAVLIGSEEKAETLNKTPGNVSSTDKLPAHVPWFLLNPPRFNEDDGGRENHNLKERRRRARIKEACDLMRSLVPGMSDKTDKATVFEFAARYIHFLKTFVGSQHDKDFLIKYSPY